MILYWVNAHDKIITALLEHIWLVVITMIFALAIATVLVVLAKDRPLLRHGLVYGFSLAYAIPSLALFALLIPLSGLGKITSVIVLVLYAQYILVRNFFLGLDEVDKTFLETAKAMGMTERQILLKVALPLASGSIISGMKLAFTSVIGIATVATTINGGGLGVLLFEGLQTSSVVKMLWGTFLAVALCLIINLVLSVIERIVQPYRF